MNPESLWDRGHFERSSKSVQPLQQPFETCLYPLAQGSSCIERTMNIDDILAEVDHNGLPQETQDLQDLTRAWVTERSAPEILPWPTSLMERVLDRIRRQVRPQLILKLFVERILTRRPSQARLSSSRSRPATRIRKPTSAS